MSDETTEARWVYIGRRQDSEKKLCHFYVPLQENGVPDMDDVKGYGKRIDQNVSVLTPAPGAVYIVHTLKQGQSVMIGGEKAPRYERMHDDAKQVAEWTVLTNAAILQDKISKRMREEMSEDVLEKSLAPILRAMRKTNAIGRSAIKLVVLDYLTRHGD